MDQPKARTAIIVPVPEPEDLVGSWRLRHDKAAQNGVPAHITLLVPFMPHAHLAEAIPILDKIFSGQPRTPFRLTHVGVFPGITWLAPDPASLFQGLTTRLVDSFPDCLPYDGAFNELIPHLTVLDDRGNGSAMTSAQHEFLAAADRSLPIEAELAEIRLIFEDDRGRWSTHTSFALAS